MKLRDKTLQKLIALSDNPSLQKNGGGGEWVELKVYYYVLLFKQQKNHWVNPVTGHGYTFLECFRKRIEMELIDLGISK